MEILETAVNGSAVLHLAGHVNSTNARELENRLGGLLANGCRSIVLDLSRLAHMTSAGFRTLLRAEKEGSAVGSTLVLCGLQGITLELFEVGGFLDMFTVGASRDEAIRLAAPAGKA